MKPFCVTFGPRGGKVIKGPDMDLYKNTVNTVFNPDLSKVRKLSPEFWGLDNGSVVPMAQSERLKVLKECGQLPLKKYEFRAEFFALGFLAGEIFATLIWLCRGLSF